MRDCLPGERFVLAGNSPRENLDVLISGAEELLLSMDPATRAMARRMIAAGLAIRDHRTDRDGRPVNLGQWLGVQSGGPLAAGTEIARRRRDRLLRHVRQAVPEWRAMSNTAAAAAMAASWRRHEATAACASARATAPAVEPGGTWWRLSRLDIATRMPGRSQLLAILADT